MVSAGEEAKDGPTRGLPSNDARGVLPREDGSSGRNPGAAPEPGGPDQASSPIRLVRNVIREEKRISSAWVVTPFGLTRGWCRAPTVAALTLRARCRLALPAVPTTPEYATTH